MPTQMRRLVRPAVVQGGLALCVLTVFAALRVAAGPPAKGTPVPSSGARRTAPTIAPINEGMAKLEFLGRFHAVGSTRVITGQRFRYTEKDAVITGDNARWDDRKSLLDAQGHLVFDDATHHAVGDRAHVNDDLGLADIRDNVVLILKPQEKAAAPNTAVPASKAVAPAPNAAAPAPGGKPNEKKGDVNDLKQHGVKVTCDHIEDQYRKKYIKLFGHLTFYQRFVDDQGQTVERTLTAQHAEYDGKAEQMVLFPPVDGHDNKGQTFHQQDNVMTFGTKEGENWVEGVGGAAIFIPHHEGQDAEKGTDAAGSKDKGKPGPSSPPSAGSHKKP